MDTNSCQFCRTQFRSGQEYCHGCGAPCPNLNLPLPTEPYVEPVPRPTHPTPDMPQSYLIQRAYEEMSKMYQEPFEKIVKQDAINLKRSTYGPDEYFDMLVTEAAQCLLEGSDTVRVSSHKGNATFKVLRKGDKVHLDCIKGSYTCTGFSKQRNIEEGDTLIVNFPRLTLY